MVGISTVGIVAVQKGRRWKHLAESFPKTYRSVLAPSWLPSNRAWKTAWGGCGIHRRIWYWHQGVTHKIRSNVYEYIDEVYDPVHEPPVAVLSTVRSQNFNILCPMPTKIPGTTYVCTYVHVQIKQSIPGGSLRAVRLVHTYRDLFIPVYLYKVPLRTRGDARLMVLAKKWKTSAVSMAYDCIERALNIAIIVHGVTSMYRLIPGIILCRWFGYTYL